MGGMKWLLAAGAALAILGLAAPHYYTLDADSAGLANSGMATIRASRTGRGKMDSDDISRRHPPHDSAPRITSALQIASLFGADEQRIGSDWFFHGANLSVALHGFSRQRSVVSRDFDAPANSLDASPESQIRKSGWTAQSDPAEAAEDQADVDDTDPTSSVPEPASLMLLGTGLLTAGGLVRYRMRSARRKEPPETH